MRKPSITVTFDESSHRSAQPDDRLLYLTMAVAGGALKAYLKLPYEVRETVHSMEIEIMLAHDGISPVELTSKISLNARMESGTCEQGSKYPLSLHGVEPDKLYGLIEEFFSKTFHGMVHSLPTSAQRNLGVTKELIKWSLGVPA